MTEPTIPDVVSRAEWERARAELGMDPPYCDVIVQRFEKFTGMKGQLAQIPANTPSQKLCRQSSRTIEKIKT